jgi:hypothetical protein
MVRSRTPSESTTVVPDSTQKERVQPVDAEVCHYSSTPPASSPCWRATRPTITMPATYGRPRPNPTSSNPTSTFTSAQSKSNGSSSPTHCSSPIDFNQDWKQKLKDIDNDAYDGEMVREAATQATSSTLTPLVSSSSLSAAPESQPLPRSSPPVYPARAYRNTEMTDDPDTSVELNTTIAMPSSDGELPAKDGGSDNNDDTDDEPVVPKRMSKHLRVLDSDEEETGDQGKEKRRAVLASTSSAMSSRNDFSQMSLDRPARSSNPTTPASSARKPIKLALSDDEESESEQKDEDEDPADRIEEVGSSPKIGRSTRKKVGEDLA